jgi:hypothetical protein
LAVLTVQAVALTLRAKGSFETFALDGFATAYIVSVIVLLLAPTISAVKNLLLLRLLASTKDR